MFQQWYFDGANGGPVYVEDADLIKLGGEYLAGKCRIASGGIGCKEDHKDVKGKSKAKPTSHGIDRRDRSAKIDIEVWVWTIAQKEAIGRVVQKVAPRRGAEPQPVAIVADALADLDVTLVRVTQVSAWTEKDRGWTRKIVCAPWADVEKPAKKPATPTKPVEINNLRTQDAERRNPNPQNQARGVAP